MRDRLSPMEEYGEEDFLFEFDRSIFKTKKIFWNPHTYPESVSAFPDTKGKFIIFPHGEHSICPYQKFLIGNIPGVIGAANCT